MIGWLKGKVDNMVGGIVKGVKNVLGIFTKEDIRNACLDVSDSTINRVFRKLKKEEEIEVLGKGRNAKWKRLK